MPTDTKTLEAAKLVSEIIQNHAAAQRDTVWARWHIVTVVIAAMAAGALLTKALDL